MVFMSEIQFLIVSVSRKSLGIRSKGILRRQCPLLAYCVEKLSGKSGADELTVQQDASVVLAEHV
jgi:hypothetical protein